MKFILCISLFLSLQTMVAFANFEFDKYRIDEVLTPMQKSLVFEFKFKNTSKNSIKITDISTTCGCTLAKTDKDIYETQEDGVIKGTFNVEDRIGSQEKQIIITTNNLSQPKITLVIKVFIPKAITIKPNIVFWRIGDENKCKTVTIEIGKNFNMNLKSIACDSLHFKVDYNEIDSNIYSLSITPLNTDQTSKARVKILLTDKNNEEKLYYIHAFVK